MEQYVELIPGWETEYFGFNQGTLGVLLALVVLGVIARAITMELVSRVFSNLSERSAIAAKTIKESRGTLGTAAAAGLFWQLSEQLVSGMDLTDSNVMMPSAAAFWLPAIAHLVMLFAIISWALKKVGMVESVVDWWDDDDELDGSERTLISALESVLRFLIVIFGAVLIANALNFNLATLIAGLGISGLALALAAKDTISNIFGAITVLLDRPFKVGDWIVTKNAEGEVMEIGLRATLLRTGTDTVITLPNANLVSQAVENFGKRRWRRYQPKFHLDLDSDPDAVSGFCEGITNMVTENQLTMKKDSSWARVGALGPESIDVNVNMYWDINSGKQERIAREQFLLDVMKLAKSLGLQFYEPRERRQKAE